MKKTEFMLIGTKAQLAKVKNCSLTVGKTVITPSEEPVRNLGTWFNAELIWTIILQKHAEAHSTICITSDAYGNTSTETQQKNLYMPLLRADSTTATHYYTDFQVIPSPNFSVCRMPLCECFSGYLGTVTYLHRYAISTGYQWYSG